MNLATRIKNLIDPLPSIEKTVLGVQEVSSLDPELVETIISTIITQAEICRDYNLFLKSKEVKEEIFFWLSFISYHRMFHSNITIHEDLKYFENLISSISTRILENFGDIGLKYLNLASYPDKYSKHPYMSHLKSLTIKVLYHYGIWIDRQKRQKVVEQNT